VLLTSEEQKEPHSHEAITVLIILAFILHLQGRGVYFGGDVYGNFGQ